MIVELSPVIRVVSLVELHLNAMEVPISSAMGNLETSMVEESTPVI